jgi:bacteriocin-like protein
MSDENKEATIDQKKAAEQKAQLSEEDLKQVSGGDIPVTKDADKSSPK